MKTSIPRAKSANSSALKLLAAALLIAAFGTASVFADVVYVTAMTSNCVSTTACGSGANPDVNSLGNSIFVENAFGSFTSAKAVAPGKPTTPGSRFYSNAFHTNATPTSGLTIQPTLAVPGGVYQLHHVYTSTAGNVSTDVVLGATNTDLCTLSFTNTDKFQRSYGALVSGQNVWQLLGFVTNNAGASNPAITFWRESGLINAGAQARLVVEVFRFSYYQPCLDIPTVGITGPLATNVPTVIVTGVSNAATAVTVYQDSGAGMVQIGQLTAGIVGGNNSVPVSGLVKGAQVAATQTLGGQEGCVPASGLSVGGGANPSLRIAFSIRYDATMTGPVGSPGTTAGNVYFLGASSVLPGSAPEQGAILQPSNCWQTVTFKRGDQGSPTDPSVLWVGAGPAILEGQFGALDGLAIASQGDSGPLQIYLDDLENGTNGVVQNWEAAAGGALDYQFSHPSVSGTTAGNILAVPNQSIVTNAASYSGVRSCRVNFQYNGAETNKWLRLVTANNVGGVVNPQLELTEPISIKVLLLPPGASPPQAVQPGPLSISQQGSEVVLNWAGSYQLLRATNVNGPYNEVGGVTTGPYTNNIAAAAAFYRLRGNNGTCN